ncbi:MULTISPECIES: MarR family winged helix-turn-helix transcriptional regulator [Staphylococcus]|jgi:DNA-binding MarR family transcriptional regulator|uniref:Transcriptional regulator n=1 Tax=Staphylococcus shinii TaxID=2912228 RepID=A0A418IFE4_9STAP|nr:MarR family transcriptional regulator [Staphylococcus shinii]MDW8565730.1 MarR family transcriptional regulator [Staphylococcus shinii]MDW8566235.1 MarR family transcriptional regulator [Staphylococcus shinii]MDW8569158.1 MarR family transcriptional regulator [Staphylococcus shinii]MDW8572259.1 MarR family transcriptional regulator [Staphylococcus shinii]MEC5300834.1 MarR family transcriptional regulator [Staphylococcus shinii]
MVKNLGNHIVFMGEFIDDVNTLLAKLLKELREEYNISKEQANVILMLENEKTMTLTEITERQGVNKAAVSRRIKKLIQAEVVEWVKTEENTDQRLKYIKLSEKGKQFNHESKSIINDIVSDMLHDLSDDEIEQARYVLEIIGQRLKNFNIKNHS